LKEVELEYENPGISEWSKYIPGGLGWLPKVNRYKIQEELNNEGLVADKKFWKTYGEACSILAKNLSEAGVTIMAGTDANLPPTVPGFSLHDELISLNNAGMSTSQVLKSATSVPATWLNSNSGSIDIGYDANLVLLDKNPLDDIRNTKTIHMVINRGKAYDRVLLDKMLEAVKTANDNSRTVEIDEFLN
jgi:adenine deaminase